jgi:NAD(P)-dependent dehydrogenase (short-subunit alcohol dehydrogenase family)
MALPPSPRCVITGAGSGLGRAIAVELGLRKAHLVLSDIDVAAAEETSRLASRAGARDTAVVACDVADIHDVEALAERSPGRIDLLVNNAGVTCAGRIGDLSLADWRWTLDVDLLGVVHGCHVFVPRLRAQGRGHVLNVASAAGLLSPPRLGAYNAAKAGVVAISETLAVELFGTGVGCTVLCPTFFRSSIARKGRFADPASRAEAETLVSRGKAAACVAKAALRSVDRGELYALPMADGRWLWRAKRIAPEAFVKLAARLLRRSESLIRARADSVPS